MKRNILLAFLLVGLVVMEWGCIENDKPEPEQKAEEVLIRSSRTYEGEYISVNRHYIGDSLGEMQTIYDTISGLDTAYFKYSNDTVWVKLTSFLYQDTFSVSPLKDYTFSNGTFVKWSMGFEINDSNIMVWEKPRDLNMFYRFIGKEK